jgi:hypothetical protein
MWLLLRPALAKFAAIAVPVASKWLLTRGLPSVKRYNDATTQARAVGGYVGAWIDDDGRHWVVLDASRSSIVGTYPRMSRSATEKALQHLDEDQLVHHDDVLLHRVTETVRSLTGVVRDKLPGGGSGDGEGGSGDGKR